MVSTLAAALLLSSQPAPDFKSVWGTVQSAIRQRYYARRTRAEEMEKLFQKFGPQAEAAKSQADFSTAVNSLIDAFQDSHFAFATTDDQSFYFMDAILKQERSKLMPHIGVWFKKNPAGEYEARMVLDGLAAAAAGIRKGDIVMQVNGKPFSPVSSLRGHVGSKPEFTIKRGATTLNIAVQVAEGRPTDMFFNATRTSARVIEHQGKSFGYLRCWSMIEDRFKNFLSMYVLRGAGMNTDGFILDLRDGFGGRPEGYYEMFFGPEMTVTWDISGMKQNQLTGYARPLIVLTNRGTRSAKEVVSMVFKGSSRATLIGDTTAGDVLGTSPMPVQDWAYLEIPMVDLSMEGVRLEDRGVDPHISLPNEYAADGTDLYLQRALAELMKPSTR